MESNTPRSMKPTRMTKILTCLAVRFTKTAPFGDIYHKRTNLSNVRGKSERSKTMKKGITARSEYDRAGHWMLVIEKQRGKLTLEKIKDAARVV